MFGINNDNGQNRHHVLDRFRAQTNGTTVIDSHTTTTITTAPKLNVGTAVRNALIGAGAGGALGAVSLLTKFSIPLLGKIGSVAGVTRLAGVGGGIGLATALWPVVSPTLDRNPTLKAAVVGAGVGAAASLVVPFVGPVFGALAGAAIGAGVKAWSDADKPGWNTNGTASGDSQGGWVAVGPASQYG
ncbi:MAG: hypothetical protein H7123_00400, partial [Thermoleophilia bacterium]|nr:hypothetical protein [Thermoleophilia bacterium]